MACRALLTQIAKLLVREFPAERTEPTPLSAPLLAKQDPLVALDPAAIVLLGLFMQQVPERVMMTGCCADQGTGEMRR